MRFDWQNQRRAVPKMKATPAGIPIMTGQGRPGDVAVGIEVIWGFRSAKERDMRKLTKEKNNKIICLEGKITHSVG